MTMTTEADKTNDKNTSENSAILRELDELMTYIDEDQASDELIDPAFFIGNMHDNGPDVPTLTTVADEPSAKRSVEEEKQPGLFSALVDSIKQKDAFEDTEQEDTKNPEVSQGDLALMVDELVAEYMPKIEAQLREKILAYLQNKKTP